MNEIKRRIDVIWMNYTGRPTEIPEDDVYICESFYDESKSLIRKFGQEGLKKFNHTPAVTEDEIYFFRRSINPAKVCMRQKYVN